MKLFFEIKVLSIFILFSVVANAQIDSMTFLENIERQKTIISKLSGNAPLNGQIYLKQRSTPGERKLTVNYLSDYLENIGWQLKNHHYKTTNGNVFLDLFFPPMRGINVSAILTATKTSDEYVVFGAHYDSERTSPGAIDNASGVAICLTVAQKLIQLNKREINFIVVLFDQEEDNEIGSRAYAKMLKKKGLNIHSVHTFDMIGWDKNKNRSLELELPTAYLKNLYETTALEMGTTVYTTKVSSSDHKSFIDQGYNALGISEEYVKGDTTPYYHKPEDAYNTVDFEYVSFATELIFNVMKKIAL